MMVVISPTNDRGGALDTLVNFWITKINTASEPPAVPEFNLEIGGAQSALAEYLAGRKLGGSVAFDLGLHLAGIVSRSPLNAEREIRAATADV